MLKLKFFWGRSLQAFSKVSLSGNYVYVSTNFLNTNYNHNVSSPDLSNPEHKEFFDEVIMLCEYDDATLLKLPCYKNQTSVIPIRKAMLRLLAACHYMPDKRQEIFQHLYKALSSEDHELQEVGYLCIQSILRKYEVDIDMVSFWIVWCISS